MTTPKKTKTKRRRNPERLGLYEATAYRALSSNLAENLRRLREEKKLSQEAASALCELPYRTFQHCETNAANVGLVTLARLMTGFGVAVGDLLESPKPKRRSRSKARTLPDTTNQPGRDEPPAT